LFFGEAYKRKLAFLLLLLLRLAFVEGGQYSPYGILPTKTLLEGGFVDIVDMVEE